MFAYGIYKNEKIEFVNSYKQNKNREPTTEELLAFYDRSVLNSSILGYREQAEILVAAFLKKSISERVVEMEDKVVQSHISSKLDMLNQKIDNKKTLAGWIKDVAANFFVNVMTILFIGTLYIGFNFYNEFNTKTANAAGIHKAN